MLAWVLLGMAALSHAGPIGPATLPLRDDTPQIDAQNLGEIWVDTLGNAGLEQALQGGPTLFQPPPPDVIYTQGD